MTRQHHFFGLAMVIVLGFIPGLLLAQTHGNIHGKIFNTETRGPVPDVNILLQPGQMGTASDENGQFEIDDLEPGAYKLILTHIGYIRKVVSIQIEATQTTHLQIGMDPATDRSLSPLTVIGRSASMQPQSELDVQTAIHAPEDAGLYLQNAPNVSGIRKGAHGIDPVIRGFSQGQLNIRMDGFATVSGACPNRMDPPTSHIQMGEVEKVEILKGPYALRYGPSFGGVVNFISQKPEYSDNLHINGHLQTGYETNINGKSVSGSISGGDSKFNFDLSGSASGYGDYKDGAGRTFPSGITSKKYKAGIGLHPADRQEVEVKFQQSFVNDADYPALMMDMREDNTTVASAGYTLQPGIRQINQLSADVYHSRVNHVMDNRDKAMAGMVNAVTDARTRVYGAKLEMTSPINSGLLFWGADYEYSNIDGIRTRNFLMGDMKGKTLKDNVWQDGKISNYGLYAEFRTHISRMQYVVSTRFDINHATAGQADPLFIQSAGSLDSDFLNWSLSAGATRSLSEKMDLGIWIGRGVRSPGMQERFINYLPVGRDPYEYIGNPQLNPESNYQGDIKIRWNGAWGMSEMTAFYSYIDQYISAKIRPDLNPKQMGVPGVKQFMNLDKARLYGFEYRFNARAGKMRFNMNAAYTIGENLENHEPLPEIPPFEADGSISYLFRNGQFEPAFSIRAVSRQNRVVESFGETETPGFLLLNSRITAHPWSNVALSAGINNIADVTYYEHLSCSVQGSSAPIYNPGRSFFFEIRVDDLTLWSK